MPRPESDRVLCCECERGGNGNDVDKCSCGWQVKDMDSNLGCFLGTAIHKESKDAEE